MLEWSFYSKSRKSEGINKICIFRARFCARLEIQTPNKTQDSKTEVIKLFEIVFMLELEYETPNFKLAAYLTSKQTQDGSAQIQRQRRRTARCKNGKIITMNN